MTTGRINQVAITRETRDVAPEPQLGDVVSYNIPSQTDNADRYNRATAIYYTRPDIPLQERTPQDDQAS